MAYTKNTWANGDVVTSEKLNHMEDGIVGAYKMVNVGNVTVNRDGFNGTLDKTWQEIHDAISNGNICYFIGTVDGDEYYKQVFIIETVYKTELEERQYAVEANGTTIYADSPTQRPTTETGGEDGKE